MLRNSIGAIAEIPALREPEIPVREAPEDAPSYLFDLLVAARRLAVIRRHKFLAYLIGMAAEEARLLTQGSSAVKTRASKTAA